MDIETLENLLNYLRVNKGAETVISIGFDGLRINWKDWKGRLHGNDIDRLLEEMKNLF